MRTNRAHRSSCPEGDRHGNRTRRSARRDRAEPSTGSSRPTQATSALGPSRKAPLGHRAPPALRPAVGVPHGRRAGDLAPGRAWRRASSADGDRLPPLGRRAVGPDPAGGLRRGLASHRDRRAASARRRSRTGSTTCVRTSPSSGRACRSPIRCARSSTSGSCCPIWSVQRALEPGHRPRRLHDRGGRDAARGARPPGPQRHRRSFGELLERRPAHRRQRGERARDAVRRPRHAGTTCRRSTLQHEVWHAGRFVGRIDAALSRAQARDRGRRLRAPLVAGGVPARPHPPEPARRARLDRAALHLGRRRQAPGAWSPRRSERRSTASTAA